MKNKDIFARRSLRDRLTVSPADYNTSPHFGDSTPHYTIKEKYPEKVKYDSRKYPDHLEANNVPNSPRYTIRPKYSEKTIKGNEYGYYPPNFGSDGLKKTIGAFYDLPQKESYVSPDKYNTRGEAGATTPRYSIGLKREFNWAKNDSPGPCYDSRRINDFNFASSPRYTINDNKNVRERRFNVPGPGTYETQRLDSLKYSIGEKLGDPKPPDGPGPDKYAKQQAWGKNGFRKTIGERFAEINRPYVGSDYITPTGGMGTGSPRTRIHEMTEDTCKWMNINKNPGPGSYAPEKIPLSSLKKTIGERQPDLRSREPITEYRALPELPRGRQCRIGEKETLMEFVL